MSKAKYIPEEILKSIQKLPEESLGELVNFIEYLKFKSSSKQKQNVKENKMTLEESEQILEEILTEVGESIPSLSDHAVSRAGIYEDHL